MSKVPSEFCRASPDCTSAPALLVMLRLITGARPALCPRGNTVSPRCRIAGTSSTPM
jgi:hypothetical protein